MKKYLILPIMVFCLGLMSMISCTPNSPTPVNKEVASSKMASNIDLSGSEVDRIVLIKKNAYGKEQMFTEASQANFNKVQPPITLKWSLERHNINKRNQRWNDPNKISYIYLLSDYGTIIAYFPIKGKVSSVNSKLTTNMQVVADYWHNGSGPTGTVESPSMDGSYGTNGDGIFFYLTDDTYMEWAGKYLLCDNYVKITQKPILTYKLQ